jgi:hypothetical protein
VRDTIFKEVVIEVPASVYRYNAKMDDAQGFIDGFVHAMLRERGEPPPNRDCYRPLDKANELLGLHFSDCMSLARYLRGQRPTGGGKWFDEA